MPNRIMEIEPSMPATAALCFVLRWAQAPLASVRLAAMRAAMDAADAALRSRRSGLRLQDVADDAAGVDSLRPQPPPAPLAARRDEHAQQPRALRLGHYVEDLRPQRVDVVGSACGIEANGDGVFDRNADLACNRLQRPADRLRLRARAAFDIIGRPPLLER